MNVRKRLGEMLLESGIIDETQLASALGHQKQWGGRLGQALVDLRLATEAQIVEALSRKFGYEVARLDALEPYALSLALKLVPREFAVKNNVFPMAADSGTITVAMSDPANVTVADELRFRTGRKVRICIGGDREIAEAVRANYPTESGKIEAIALDLDGGDAGEPVFDAFGGGSLDALDAFFGSPPAPPPAIAPAPRSPGRLPSPGAAPVGTPRSAMPAGEMELDLEEKTPMQPPPVGDARSELLGEVPDEGFVPEPDEITAVPIDELFTPSPAPIAPPAPAAAARATFSPSPAPAPSRGPQSIAAPPSPPPAPAPEEMRVAGRAGERELTERELTERELAVIDALESAAPDEESEPAVVKPVQAMAALVRLMLRKKIISEQELLEELTKK